MGDDGGDVENQYYKAKGTLSSSAWAMANK